MTRSNTSLRQRITTSLNHESVQRTNYYFSKIVGAVLVIAGAYGMYVFAPVLSKKYQFDDAIQRMALASAYNDDDAYQIENELMEEARKIGIPLREENLHVIRDEGFVRIEATYQVPIALATGRVITLTFSPSSTEKASSHALIQAKKAKEGK